MNTPDIFAFKTCKKIRKDQATKVAGHTTLLLATSDESLYIFAHEVGREVAAYAELRAYAEWLEEEPARIFQLNLVEQ